MPNQVSRARPIVWHLLSNRWNSAITEYALSAARALETAGYHSVFSPLAASPAEARARSAGLTTRALPGFGWRHRAMVADTALNLAPDYVVTYGGPETTLTAWLEWRGLRAGYVRFRGQEVPDLGVWARVRHRMAHRHVGLHLAPGRELAERVRRLGTRGNVEVVTLGVDERRFYRSNDQANELTEDGAALGLPRRPALVIFGRLDPVKGHRHFFGLFAQVLAGWNQPPGIPRPRLVVVGEEANTTVAELSQTAESLGLAVGGDVRFVRERVKEVAPLLSSAVLGVVPSLGSELICRVAEEFLLCGTPVVVSGAGSLDEVLFDAAAGGSYRGLAAPDAADLILRWYLQSVSESETVKAGRADNARRIFGLTAMGRDLDRALKSVKPT